MPKPWFFMIFDVWNHKKSMSKCDLKMIKKVIKNDQNWPKWEKVAKVEQKWPKRSSWTPFSRDMQAHLTMLSRVHTRKLWGKRVILQGFFVSKGVKMGEKGVKWSRKDQKGAKVVQNTPKCASCSLKRVILGLHSVCASFVRFVRFLFGKKTP